MLLQLVEEMLTLVGGLCIAYFIYMFLARRSNDKPTTNSPAMAHSALRGIIEQVIEEAKRLPGFGDSISAHTESTQDGRNIIAHSYEELLATAILNKVVEQFQRNQVDGNKTIINNKTVLSIKPSLSIDGSEHKHHSTIESMSQSYNRASAAQEGKHSEPLTLTLEERIEEITTYTSEENHQDNNVLPISNSHRVPFPELGMDIIDPFQESSDIQEELDIITTHYDMVSPVASWEENWLFQKKKISMQANPVAMLVPNSTAEFKALIGDRDAEDTSDLSECSSMQSDEMIEKELFEVISNVQSQPLEKVNSSMKNESNASNLDNVKKVENNACTESTNAEIANCENSTTDMRSVCKTDEITQSQMLMEHYVERVQIAKNNVDDKQKSLQHCTFTRQTTEEEERDDLDKNFNEKDVINENVKNAENVIQIEHDNNEMSHQTKNIELVTAVCDNTIKDFNNEKDKMAKTQVLNNNTINISFVKEEQNVLDVPRTPVCTPTFTLQTDDFQYANNATFFASNSLILNSLESAKQKLINADESKMNINEPGEADLHADKITDFCVNAEDVQQESEYTEHYDIAIQRHLDSLTKDHAIDNEHEKSETSIPCDVSAKHKESNCKELSDKEFCDNLSTLRKTSIIETGQFAMPPRPGSIAEREHQKWANAPPIENNPYSEENIQRRLWERQYSRVSSDIQGMHADLPKSIDIDLEDVLLPHAPDIKRFGRDYYINNSKKECNGKGQKSIISSSSRPSSSLSQKSSSTSANQDSKFQEEPQNKGADVVLNSHNNVKLKVAQWQKNNIEPSYQATMCAGSNFNSTVRISEIKEIAETCLKESGMPVCCQKSFEKQQAEEMENQRKNSKNEINAKLNNQENNYDGGAILETKNSDENRKKIQRIDLKAFGFENEISPNVPKSDKISSERVVNRLNLASFGYDGGLRRVQSNNQLDSTIKDYEFKSEVVGITNKLNLSIHRKFKYYDDHMKSGILRNDNLTRSSEALNKTYGSTRELHSLKTAKSVPNISNYESYLHSTNKRGRTIEMYNAQNLFGGTNQLDTVNATKITKSIQNCGQKKFTENNSEGHDNNPEIDTNYSLEKEDFQSKDALMTHTDKQKSPYIGYKKLPLPSVKLLAQAFNKQPDSPSAPMFRAVKSDRICQERSATPEVHIVETPKQMHSLTARSLSKKFREGLKQMPNKMTSPPASHVTMEQQHKITDNELEDAQIKSSNSQDDIDAILPGKLKSNIIFWEQLQKRK